MLDAGPGSVSMWSRLRPLVTDPRMVTVWIFTAFLVVVFSVVSARPWNATAVEETTKNLQECEYFQADGREIFNYNIDDIQIKKCVDKIWAKLQKQERRNKRKERRKRRKGRKKKPREGRGRKNRKGRKKVRRRRPETRSGGGAQALAQVEPRRKRMKRQRKMFLEQEEFRKWKRKISVANLLAEPVAQDAISDLWTDLLGRGPEWEQIYLDMHQVGTTNISFTQKIFAVLKNILTILFLLGPGPAPHPAQAQAGHRHNFILRVSINSVSIIIIINTIIFLVLHLHHGGGRDINTQYEIVSKILLLL